MKHTLFKKSTIMKEIFISILILLSSKLVAQQIFGRSPDMKQLISETNHKICEKKLIISKDIDTILRSNIDTLAFIKLIVKGEIISSTILYNGNILLETKQCNREFSMNTFGTEISCKLYSNGQIKRLSIKNGNNRITGKYSQRKNSYTLIAYVQEGVRMDYRLDKLEKRFKETSLYMIQNCISAKINS